MLDLPFLALSAPFPAGFVPANLHSTFDPALPFSLTLPDCNPAAAMSGEARPRIIGHFTALAEAMRGAIKMAEELAPDAAPRMLAIFDRDERLVLAGAAANGAVAWCAPVMTATEARSWLWKQASFGRRQAVRRTGWRAVSQPACGSVPISWKPASSIHSGAPLPRSPCRSRHDPREAEEGRGLL